MHSVTSGAVAGALTDKGHKNGTFGLLGGAAEPEALTLHELWQVLCGGNGKGGICGGSFQFTDGDGWRNFPMVGQSNNIYVYNTRHGATEFLYYKTL